MHAGAAASPASEAALDGEIRRLEAELDELRAEQERLRESEKMYRIAAQLSGRMVWSADAEGRIDAMSGAFETLTGEQSDKTLGGGWLDFVHADDRDAVARTWAQSVRTGEPFAAEFRALLKDGKARWVISRAVAVRDSSPAPEGGKDGRVRRWYGAVEDIHEERASEQARREVEERYRLAVQATNDAVWDYDVGAGSIDWSENSGGIFRSGGEPIGCTSYEWWEERVHPDDRARVVRGFAGAIERGDTHWSDTYRFLRDDGSYAEMLDRGFLIRDAEGRTVRVVGAMADLTERNRADAEIRRMQTELIHFSRLSAMGTMASTLAHELNQPLAAISNFVTGAKRLAGKLGESSPELLEALDAASSGAQRAGEIVRRLRELVSRGTVSVHAQPLPQLIEEASVLAFVDEGKLGVRHRIELDPAAKWVLADRVQIQQVLINLVRNAIEAMADSDTREVVISTRTCDPMIEIAVADTGPGIAPEHIDNLFSHFMTTKSGGMGIGLPISRTIVELHGGTLWAENCDEGGAVFRFTLPKARPRQIETN